MTPLLIFGSALIYLLIHSHQTYEKLQSLSNDFTKIVTDIEELKTNEEILEKEVHSKHSFVDFLRIGEYGYFQKFEHRQFIKQITRSEWGITTSKTIEQYKYYFRLFSFFCIIRSFLCIDATIMP